MWRDRNSGKGALLLLFVAALSAAALTGCDWDALGEALLQSLDHAADNDRETAREILKTEFTAQAKNGAIEAAAPRVIPVFSSLVGIGAAEKDFLEFKDKEPVPYSPVGVSSIDRFGQSTYVAARASHDNAVNYIEMCDRHRVWSALQNDVTECMQAGSRDRATCERIVLESLSPEHARELRIFMSQQASTIDAQIEMMSSYIDIISKAEEFYGGVVGLSEIPGDERAEAIDKRLTAIRQVGSYCEMMKAGLNYFNHQKRIMVYLEEHRGR